MLLGACGNNSTTNDKNTSEVNTSQENTKMQDTTKNNVSEKEAKTAEEAKNCAASEVHAYLNDTDTSGTNIRNSPGGDVVVQLVKNEEDAAFFLTLIEARDGWFKVKSPIGGMENDVEIPNGEGWIHSSMIAVSTRNYDGQDLELLDHPKNGNVVGVIEDESYGLQIKDFCGTWVKVSYKGTIGWIDGNWLCGNPLTSCS